jgi:transposase InsO family protein
MRGFSACYGDGQRLTPYRSPNANAYAERWVRSVRDECLSKLLIVNEALLRSVMREYVAYHNTARPHQGLAQLTPIPRPPTTQSGKVRRREVLGGIIVWFLCLNSSRCFPTS